MIDKTELKKLIPAGDYCYSYTGRFFITNKYMDNDGNVYVGESYRISPETKPCPFWKNAGRDAFCSFLEKTSVYGDASLLWDQIKDCGENVANLQDPEEYVTVMERKSKARELKTPQFVQILVDTLSQSSTNSFTYDGITYTLDQDIYDQFNPKN